MKSRIVLLLTALVVAVLTVVSDVRAADEVPATLAAQLAMKIVSYDRNQAERAKKRPRVLVYQKASDERSVRAATMVAQALRDPDIGKGAPIDVVAFSSAADVASAIDARAASVVIFVTGLEESAAAIAGALAGKDVLSIGTTGALAERGTVVGFEIREGKPKIVVSLARAQAQNVSLRAELLALARIVP